MSASFLTSPTPVHLDESQTTAQNQIWSDFLDTVRRLRHGPSMEPDLTTSSIGALKTEKDHLDTAIDQISLLIKLKKGETLPPGVLPTITTSIPTPPNIGTPNSTSGGGGGGGIKRKRKLSISGSPAPSFGNSIGIPPIPNTASSIESNLTSIASPATIPGARGGTPMSREATTKAKKELYADQLPLQPGRRIAFRTPPPAGADKNDGDGTDQNWILATIKRCIGGDKMRYEVQDEDPDEITGKLETYNTTLRSIIPLPDKKAPTTSSAHPSNLEDYPKGTQVLAVYPDTSSFYQATVMSAPIPGTGMGLGVRGGNGKAEAGALRGLYRLQFVDDGDKMHPIDPEKVLLHPTFPSR